MRILYIRRRSIRVLSNKAAVLQSSYQRGKFPNFTFVGPAKSNWKRQASEDYIFFLKYKKFKSDKKKPAMLSLEPCGELVFEDPYPFDHFVLKTLVIRNPIKNQKVAFKLKTTTPTMFFVRPNVGVLNPDEKINVKIYMHPNAPEADKKQHKFLIQAALALGEITNLKEFWKMQKSANIWDVKLKCVIAQGI